MAALLVLLATPAAASAKAGALDPGFGDNGRVVTPADVGRPLEADVNVAEGPDGTIVAAVGKTVFRYLPDGSLDPSFGQGGRLTIAEPEGLPFSLHDLVVDPMGRIALIGEVKIPDVRVQVDYMGGTTNPYLAAVIRYDRTGRLDPSFGDGNGFILSDLGQPRYLPSYDRALTRASQGVVDREGRLTLLGSVSENVPSKVGHSFFATFSRLLVRLAPDGELDASFGSGGVSQTGLGEIKRLALGRDEAPLVLGPGRPHGDRPPHEVLMQLRPDGGIDPEFGHNGGSPTVADGTPGELALALDSHGDTVVLAGKSVERFTPEGVPDWRFGYRGSAAVTLPGGSGLSSIALESSGDILLAGTQAMGRRTSGGQRAQHRSFMVVTLNSHGKADLSFGRRGRVATGFGRSARAFGQEAFIDAEGRLVVGGPIARPDLGPTGGIALARYQLEPG